MNKIIRNTIILILSIIICFYLIFKIELKLNNIQKEKKLVETGSVNNAPPLIAFTTIALGGFRGIIADILWLRAILLQNQGKYFEMVQLASWISKLQPGFTGTTTFLAWNMAYNISITYANPEDKLRWVENAIKILKDAINDTPGKPDLYAEVAWLYLHKIGTFYDSSNAFYKNELIKDMYKITGSWTPDWESYAEAPENNKQLLGLLKNKFGMNIIYKDLDTTPDKLLDYFKQKQELPPQMLKLLNRNKEAEPIIKFYLSKKLLLSEFDLSAKEIIEVNKTFGKLNWFLCQSHALYWLYSAPSEPLLDNKKFISFLFFGLRQALDNGELLLFDSNNDNVLFTGPNINIIKNTQKFLYKTLLKSKYENIYSRRYKSFMNSSILYLHIFGKIEEAKYYKNLLEKQFPEDKEYKLDFSSFMSNRISERYDVSSIDMMAAEINYLLKLSKIYSCKNKNNEAKSIKYFAKILYTSFSSNNSKKFLTFQKLEKSIDTNQINKFLVRD